MHQQVKDETIEVLKDRRSNTFIRSRQRRNFDRRKSFRVGASALALLSEADKRFSGVLRDVSESGACVELKGTEYNEWSRFHLTIPVLLNKKISCKMNWFENNNNHELYGIEFLDLDIDEKTELRKRFLLDETLLMAHAVGVVKKIDDFRIRQEIKTFFLIDLRMAIESLIEIDRMVAEGENDEIIAQKCKKTLDKLANAGDWVELSINNASLIKSVKQRVRFLIGHFLYQSKNFRRGFEKPRGYPGDYKMLEIVYDDMEISQGIGKHIDRYGLDVPYSWAIRMRKDKMKEILYDFINNSPEESLNILNLASGACRDIREMFDCRPIKYKGKVNLMCIDQDEEAIEFTQRKLSVIDTGNIGINLIQGNILKLESLEIGNDNSVDMIYSIGIADYLQDRMLDKIFKDCYKKLKPGGKLVIAYKDKNVHKPIALNWFADWNFIPRNEEEFIGLINNSMGKENISIEIERESSGVIFFTKITKNR